MTETAVTEELMRRFLLGELDDEERQRIEKIFISDSDVRDTMLAVEDDLVEDYLENSLSANERQRFISHYLAGPQQQLKLSVARSLKELAVTAIAPWNESDREGSSQARKWRSYLKGLKIWHRLLIPLAAVLGLSLIFGVVRFVQLQRTNALKAEADQRRLVGERELADLNTPASLAQTLPADQLDSLVVSPGSRRGLGQQAEVTPTAKLRFVELRLVWTKDEYPVYRVVLQKAGTPDQLTLPGLRIEKESQGKVIRIRIPIQLLSHGSYQVEVKGGSVEGHPEQSEEYTFFVNG